MTNEARSNQAPVASLPPEAATEEERQGRRRRRAETSKGDADNDDRASKVVVGRCVPFAPRSDTLAAAVAVVTWDRVVSIVESCILEKAVFRVVKKELD